MRCGLALVGIGLLVLGACASESTTAGPPTVAPELLADGADLVNQYTTSWGAALACPPDDDGLQGTIGESEPVPELQEPITEAEALAVVRDLVRRKNWDGAVATSELYFVERNPVLGLVTAVAAPWEPGTTQPIGAYFEFEGTVLMRNDGCSSFLYAPEGSE